MKLVCTFSLLFAVAALHVQANRIVGGEPTTIEKYPSIVQVEFRFAGIFWEQQCAGVILNSRYVLSAAHCFMFGVSPEHRRIRAGSSDQNAGGTIIEITWFLRHPTFGAPFMGFDGDVVIAQLDTSLTFGDAVQSIPIPPQGFELPDGLPVVHAGWGDVEQGSQQGSPVLRDVTIYTINRNLCKQRYSELPDPGLVTDNMICAGILDVGGKDACQGDSGGPLYFVDSSDNEFLVGIVSWGHGCANETYPGISARVSAYTDWILETAV